MKEEKNLLNVGAKYTKIVPYVFNFVIFSILGWALETFYCYLILGEFIERGFLYSPLCPIYGSGALILMLYLRHQKTTPNCIKLFILFMIIYQQELQLN